MFQPMWKVKSNLLLEWMKILPDANVQISAVFFVGFYTEIGG